MKVLDDIANEIFEQLILYSKKLSKGNFMDLKAENRLYDLYDFDYVEKAKEFEGIVLLYTHLFESMAAKKPVFWNEINSKLFPLIVIYIENNYKKINDSIDYMNLFLTRLSKYGEGSFKTLLENIAICDCHIIADDMAIPLDFNADRIQNNSTLFYFWNREPLSIHFPKPYDLNEQDVADYKCFVGTYFAISLGFFKKILEIVE